MTIEYTGSLQGSVRKHTEATLRETFVNAYVVLPEAGGAPKVGLLNEFANETASHPTVVFMHGSSGVNAQIKTFAYWLADALRGCDSRFYADKRSSDLFFSCSGR